MGLDMYLTGEKFFWTDWQNPSNSAMEDGFRLKAKRLDLGYWRKHPDLHGFIVQKFADGTDDCKDIALTEGDIEKIIAAIKDKSLPKTEGFFFGESDGSETEESIQILERALEWMRVKDPDVSRGVFYRASW